MSTQAYIHIYPAPRADVERISSPHAKHFRIFDHNDCIAGELSHAALSALWVYLTAIWEHKLLDESTLPTFMEHYSYLFDVLQEAIIPTLRDEYKEVVPKKLEAELSALITTPPYINWWIHLGMD
jgi:hypothetical protein